jgi:hypothetical protein
MHILRASSERPRGQLVLQMADGCFDCSEKMRASNSEEKSAQGVGSAELSPLPVQVVPRTLHKEEDGLLSQMLGANLELR